jgi:hypothetical protein
MRSAPPWHRAAIVTLFLAGCGPAVTPAVVNGEAAPAAPVAAATAIVQPAVDPAPVPPAAAKTPEPEVLASDSSPPGITKLSKEEGAFAQKACAPLSEALAAAAKKKKLSGPADRNAFVQEFLQNPPPLPRIDVAKCADLLLRDVRGYIAAVVESEAKMNLGRVVVGLASSLDREPPASCASAGPVPADLGALAAGPWVSKPEDWSAPGWACTRFNLGGEPQRFQYQLVTSATSWEVVARGFPVKGGAPTELYARGLVEGGHIQPSREVYRRTPTK